MYTYILTLFHKIDSSFKSSPERTFPLYLLGYFDIATEWINYFEIW